GCLATVWRPTLGVSPPPPALRPVLPGRLRFPQFLAQLEEGAVQLDRMKMGLNISSVVGSSVGLVGGVLSIVGLAIAPLTAGVSLTLTMVGVGLGVTSGVNSITTGVTELAVNAHQGEKVNGVFQSFMEDVKTLLECLNQVANSRVMKMEPDKVDTVVGAGKVVVRTGVLAKSIDPYLFAFSDEMGWMRESNSQMLCGQEGHTCSMKDQADRMSCVEANIAHLELREFSLTLAALQTKRCFNR
uniref:Uncharacterized protein n=1 Tax=Scleropages formosus TaxID=113540 RepID=A0A8C9WJE0_SCLFO